MSSTTKSLYFKKIPSGYPVAGEHLAVENVPFDPEAPAPESGLTLNCLYTSFDPYMRGRMRPADVKSYSPAYGLDEPIPSATIAKVIKSRNDKYKVGDIVIGLLPIQQNISLPESHLKFIRPLENPEGIKDLRVFLGPLGMPGLTAYASLFEIGKPKKGDTIFISSAASAVGQVVGQIAKHEGLTVIGSVGSDEKLDYILKDLGFHSGFNYKKEKPADALKRLAPNGIDIYFENVGGDHFEAALEHLNDFGRIVACGMISQYNLSMKERYPIKNLHQFISKRLTMRGFIVNDPGMGDKWTKEHLERVSKWIKDGSFIPLIAETEGIDNAADGLVGIFHGKNLGKAVLKL